MLSPVKKSFHLLFKLLLHTHTHTQSRKHTSFATFQHWHLACQDNKSIVKIAKKTEYDT